MGQNCAPLVNNQRMTKENFVGMFTCLICDGSYWLTSKCLPMLPGSAPTREGNKNRGSSTRANVMQMCSVLQKVSVALGQQWTAWGLNGMNLERTFLCKIKTGEPMWTAAGVLFHETPKPPIWETNLTRSQTSLNSEPVFLKFDCLECRCACRLNDLKGWHMASAATASTVCVSVSCNWTCTLY